LEGEWEIVGTYAVGVTTLADMRPVEAMEMLVSRIRKTKSNAEFLMDMNMA
jgi:transcription termination factor Rho